MAVSPECQSIKEFFTSIGMLIIQGRKWDSFRRVRGRGLHCPTVRNSSPPHHQCSLNNLECQTALSFQHTIESIWHKGGVVTIEVILLPECNHTESPLLLERWTLKSTNELSKMNELSLMQAVDSTIHFSQLSSWWSSTNGSQPKNIKYNVCECDDNQKNVLDFCDSSMEHQFPPSSGLNVHLKSLPRRSTMPNLYCASCPSVITRHVDSLISQNRGRRLLQKRSGSRQSSVSSGSLSPSSSSCDAKSPLGSPLLSFWMTLSSSSSRESSRETSPSVLHPSSEGFPARLFQVTDVLSHEDEMMTNQVVMETIPINPNIDQDEELANQLDSLSDSDLSDDYVIDGPIGSPGFVGTPIASPDDSRVQMLQSTFAGFHCRHPAFDRLMGEDFGGGETRTRHSSLDSAVSNLEKLDLEARRKLSRTNSDGNKFEKLKDNHKDLISQPVFIRDRKKRHRERCDNGACSMLRPAQSCSDCHETYYASFQTNLDSECKQSSVMELLNASDRCMPDGYYDFNSLRPSYDSTLATVGFSSMEYSNVPRPISPICDPMTEFVDREKLSGLELFTSNSLLLNQSSIFPLLQHNDTTMPSQDSGVFDETPVSSSLMQQYIEHADRKSCYDGFFMDSVHPRMTKRDGSPNATAKEVNIQQHRKGFEEDLKLNLEHLSEEKDSENACSSSTASLLRSPPSKLRVLPSSCVEKKYEHNPPREVIHKQSPGSTCSTIRKLQFNPPGEKAAVTSPAPVRRNNSVRFEFDEDMSKLNRRSSRSICKGKCMKKNGIIVHNHNHLLQTRRLLGSFEHLHRLILWPNVMITHTNSYDVHTPLDKEGADIPLESIIHDRLEVLGTVDGFEAQLGASGSFCPSKVKLPVPVCFFHVCDDNAPSPYMGTMSLKGKECAKRGYHIPRKGTIQLTLFNPNNSVVKVFVILYDVSDMPPGHRTFLRHRIFSKPVDDTINSESRYVDADGCPKQNQPHPKLLRYFVHLWLESSKTNKIYIHGNIKILFSLASNEWDSGNTFELQTETEFPRQPRYSSRR